MPMLLCFLLLSMNVNLGSIGGGVADAAGAVVAGAAIEAKNAETGAQYKTESAKNGGFTFADMPDGEYEIHVSMRGFKPDARRRGAGDAVTSSRSANATDAHAPREPIGRMGIAGRALGGSEKIRVYFELTNIGDSRYSTVVGYPDYGRQFCLGIRQMI